jgi:hypothetical protein
MHKNTPKISLGFVALTFLVACSAEQQNFDAAGNGSQPQAGFFGGNSIGDVAGGTAIAGGGQAGSTASDGTGTGPAATTSPEEQCSGVSKKAESQRLPSDIIWAIDTSGSMSGSFSAIENALNKFAQKMDAAAIDAHIILIAGAGATADFGGAGFCMPAPLGSGQCGSAAQTNGSAPDSQAPRFLHLDAAFGMSQAVPFILDNFPNYKHLLRPNARTQFVITEDFGPMMTADEVKNHIEGRAQATFTSTPAWDPPLKEGTWQFNGVVCKAGLGIGPCILAVVPPQTTLDLISSTGGLVGELQDAATGTADPFAELLDKLAQAVITGAVSCEYEIPPPPDGLQFDPEKVNVEYTNGAQIVTVIPKLPATQSACDTTVGWRYDNPAAPTRVVLCPAACKTVQSDAKARVDVKFGCKTIVILK